LLHNLIYLARISLFNNCDPLAFLYPSLVKRGEILFAYDYLDMWDDNLDRMNENKKGKILYLVSMILKMSIKNIKSVLLVMQDIFKYHIF
jgi:hypothetical protein